jgi:uncharacterized protein (DUF1330 family)
MAKGYWIARVRVKDPEAYKAYVAANGPAFATYGGRFLVRGGRYEVMEGDHHDREGSDRNVVIEFPSVDQALACYRSEAYAQAKALRQDASIGELVIIEGYEGPQPA